MTLPARGTLLVAVALTIAVGLPAQSAAAAPISRPLPKLSAASYVLADLDTGEVLAERNPHGHLRPASTLKVLTALTLLPELEPAGVYTAVFDDANVEGSKVGVVPDATYTVHNLFQGMFLMSGNDAANALANANGGVRHTVAAMNRTARDLGALDTKAVNPSGLDANGQYTSAYDLALIARAALERKDFRDYVTTIKARFPGKMPKKHRHRRSFEIYTQNKLVLNYRGAIGVKTGWTTRARGTFIGAATRRDRTLVAVVMRTKHSSWEESRSLLDWGFANATLAVPVDTLNPTSDEPEPTAGEQPLGKQAAAVAADTASAVRHPPVAPWYAWLALTSAVVLAGLRARVMLLRRRRRRLPPAHPLLRQAAR